MFCATSWVAFNVVVLVVAVMVVVVVTVVVDIVDVVDVAVKVVRVVETVVGVVVVVVVVVMVVVVEHSPHDISVGTVTYEPLGHGGRFSKLYANAVSSSEQLPLALKLHDASGVYARQHTRHGS